ncbi:MAG: MotA/TolQ/ExbB proton channel family protein [Treponemataceae bacterium]|nr:MAG: MotA/TolQ/ExbB proton channel family protein [Treponemataceae bacterium]
MFAMLKSGGFIMFPIAACAILIVYIVYERFRFFLRIENADKDLAPALSDLLGKRAFIDASKLCEETGTPSSGVLKKIIDCRNMNESGLRELADAEIANASLKFAHFLPFLGALSHIATLLGFLGTVLANIRAFSVWSAIQQSGEISASFSASIAQSLITTAAGIIVAIPAVVFSHYFNERIIRLETKLESDTTFVILRITRGLTV